MKKLYIIGDPVKHSLSPVIYNAALKSLGIDTEYTYEKMRVKKEELKEFISKVRYNKITGASVTLPHKENIIPFLDELTKEANLLESVNTIYVKNGRVVGHNTDGIGFLKAFEEAGVKIVGKRVILLGAGGAAKAIAFTLALNEVSKLVIINRRKKNADNIAKKIEEKTNVIVQTASLESLKTMLKDADIIINATSVGMKGLMDNQTLINADLINSKMTVMDIVYNPRVTMFLKEAEKSGAKTIDGTGMFVHQGTEQFKIFTGRKPPIAIMKNALLEALDETCS